MPRMDDLADFLGERSSLAQPNGVSRRKREGGEFPIHKRPLIAVGVRTCMKGGGGGGGETFVPEEEEGENSAISQTCEKDSSLFFSLLHFLSSFPFGCHDLWSAIWHNARMSERNFPLLGKDFSTTTTIFSSSKENEKKRERYVTITMGQQP